MAKAGDYYTVTLKKSHLNWGTHRYTGTRGDVLGEGYIPIPKDVSRRFHLVNSNGTNGGDELGKNLFSYTTADGSTHGYLKAQGCNTAGDIYAKQFSGDGDLKAIGAWFAHIGATEGTIIKVEWLSSTEILLSRVGGNQKMYEAYSTAINNVRQPVQPRSITPVPPKTEPVKPKLISVSVGERLIHKAFGRGIVYAVEGNYVRIRFDTVGEKSFVNPDAFTKGFLKKE